MARPIAREIGRQQRLESALEFQMSLPVGSRNEKKIAEFNKSLARLQANQSEIPETGNPVGANIGVPLG